MERILTSCSGMPRSCMTSQKPTKDYIKMLYREQNSIMSESFKLNLLRRQLYSRIYIYQVTTRISRSTSYLDELTWASLWLYKATGSIQYLEDSEALYNHLNTSEESRFFYNSKRMGILVMKMFSYYSCQKSSTYKQKLYLSI